MEKLPHYYFSWIVSSRNRDKCQMRDASSGEEKILEIERGSTRSYHMENSLWKRLRTCRKTDYRMNEDKISIGPGNHCIHFSALKQSTLCVHSYTPTQDPYSLWT
jgi:hypothetical protein